MISQARVRDWTGGLVAWVMVGALLAPLKGKGAAAPEPVAAVAAVAGGATPLFALDGEEFRRRPEASARLEWKQLQPEVMAAAILHETNRRRAAEGLPALKDEPRLREAAQVQSAAMAKGRFLSHENPGDAKQRTPVDRIKAAGLVPGFAAENVALAFGLQYESGREFYTEEDGSGGTLFRYEENGPAIQPHTYQSFAEALVKQWMESPGHRQNILDPRPTHLGSAAALSRNPSGMEVFYCTQVFFRPRE